MSASEMIIPRTSYGGFNLPKHLGPEVNQMVALARLASHDINKGNMIMDWQNDEGKSALWRSKAYQIFHLNA